MVDLVLSVPSEEYKEGYGGYGRKRKEREGREEEVQPTLARVAPVSESTGSRVDLGQAHWRALVNSSSMIPLAFTFSLIRLTAIITSNNKPFLCLYCRFFHRLLERPQRCRPDSGLPYVVA